MEFYFIGFFVVALGAMFFVAAPSRLYYFTVFSIPFTATAVFKITSGPFTIDGIRASVFLGALCLLRYMTAVLVRGRLAVHPAQRMATGAIILFAVSCMLSLIMPAIINRDLMVYDVYEEMLTHAVQKPLVFKFQYVTQVAFVVFGCLIACYFAVKNNTEEQLQRTIRTYLKACWFVCFWGVFEVVIYYMGLPWPGFLFNAAGETYEGTLVLGGTPRISSVALEPSIMAQQLLTALPLVFWPYTLGESYLKGLYPRYLIIAILVVLMLSTSATAYAGLLAFLLLVWQRQLSRKRFKLIVGALAIVAVVGLIIALPVIIEIAQEKLTTFSGKERMLAVILGFTYFSKYPVLGIGWGVFPTWDLVICILTGAGLVGLIALAVAVVSARKYLTTPGQTSSQVALQVSLWHSLLLLLIASEISGFIYHVQFFWFILGIAIGAGAMVAKAKLSADTSLPTGQS